MLRFEHENLIYILYGKTIFRGYELIMFTIILHDKNNNEVERLFLEGNEVYLQRDDERSFPELSELSDSSYDTFGQDAMSDLVSELISVRNMLNTSFEKNHIDDIIRLAIICKNKVGFTLTFTPFAGYVPPPL